MFDLVNGLPDSSYLVFDELAVLSDLQLFSVGRNSRISAGFGDATQVVNDAFVFLRDQFEIFFNFSFYLDFF